MKQQQSNIIYIETEWIYISSSSHKKKIASKPKCKETTRF